MKRPVFRLLNAEYKVYEDDSSERLVGHAIVQEGVIETLAVRDDIAESYTGQILSTLITNLISEADRLNSNLSIRLSQEEPTRMKRFLERFGFRETASMLFKRTAGSIRPPTPIY